MSQIQRSLLSATTSAASARNHIRTTDGSSVVQYIVPFNCLAVTYSAINVSLGGYCPPVLSTVVRFAASTSSTLVVPQLDGTSSNASSQHLFLASRASRSSRAMAFRWLRRTTYSLLSRPICGARGTSGARPIRATASWWLRRSSST